ncbi:MAG: hypothetical protein WCO25_01160 [Candidatus Uhrbacteria bacterium]
MSKNEKQRRKSIRHTDRGELAPAMWRRTPAFLWMTEERWYDQKEEAKSAYEWIYYKVFPLLERAGYWSHNPGILGEFSLEDFLEETSHDPEFWDEEARGIWRELTCLEWLT